MSDDLAERFCPHLGMGFEELYAVLGDARDEPPFYWPPLDAWVVSRQDDVLGVLRDPTTFSNVGVLRPVPWAPSVEIALQDAGVANIADTRWMGLLDGDDHREMRASVNRIFTPRRVQGMAASIQATIDELLDAVNPNEPFDLVASLAYPLPIRVIVDLIGADPAAIGDIRTWTDDLIRLMVVPMDEQDQLACVPGVIALNRYVGGVIDTRRAAPGWDFLSALIVDADAGMSRWRDDELRHLIAHGLILAGHETTCGAISNGVHHLLANRTTWLAALADRALIPALVEEVLRYDTPTLGSFRTVTADTVVGGQPVASGARVYWVGAAANHDPAHHDDPERFRLDRGGSDAAHLSFGHGTHYCLGAPLAKLEMAMAFEALLDRFPGLGPAADRVAVYEPSPLLRHHHELWVRAGGHGS